MTSVDPHLATPSGRVRARGLGIHLPGRPGPVNAITDVAGLEVGSSTIIDEGVSRGTTERCRHIDRRASQAERQ